MRTSCLTFATIPILAFGLCCIGCGNTPDPESRDSHPDKPFELSGEFNSRRVFLHSELKEPVSLSADFVVANRSSNALTTHLESMSCTCTRIDRVDGDGQIVEPVVVGERILIVGSGTQTFRVTVRVSAVAAHQSALSRFVIQDVTGSISSFDSTIAIDVVADAVSIPSVLSHRFLQRGPRVVEKRLAIDVCSRNDQTSVAGLSFPDWVALTSIRSETPVQQKSGLWVTRWTADLTLTRPPNDSDLPLHDQCRFRIRDGQIDPLSVPVTMAMSDGLSVMPNQIHLGDVPAETTVIRRVRVTGSDGVNFKVTRVTSDSKNLSVTLEPLEEAAERQWLVLSFIPQAVGSGKAVIRISTDHPHTPVLDIPIRFDVKEK